MKKVTVYTLHGHLFRETFGCEISDQDAFLVFVLFHMYRVELSGDVLSDCPGATGVAALTQRSVSEAIATAWRATKDDRANPYYWYYRWNTEWDSYRHAEHLSEEEQARLEQLKAKLEAHPLVHRLVPED